MGPGNRLSNRQGVEINSALVHSPQTAMFPVNAGLPDLPLNEEAYSVDYSALNRRIAVGTSLGAVHIYDNTSAQVALVQSLSVRSTTPVTVRWATNGEILLVTDQTGYVDLWSQHGSSGMNSQAPPFHVAWTNYGLDCPVTSAQFIPCMQQHYNNQAPAKNVNISFVYGSVDGSLTCIFTNPNTSQWDMKKHDDVHQLGVTSVYTVSTVSDQSAKIITGGSDGYIRVNSITYFGELEDQWKDVRVSLKPVVSTVERAGSDELAILDITGSVTFLNSTEGVFKPSARMAAETPDTVVKQLLWLEERQVLCAVVNDGDVLCLEESATAPGMISKRQLAEVLGM